MGMLRAVTIAFLAALGAIPAGADGPPPGTRPDPYRYTPYEPAPGFFDFNWSGFYAGAHLGGAHTSFEATETDFDPPLLLGPLTLTYDQAASSVVGGVQAGWQKQWDKIVAGIEVTYSALPFDETTPSPVIPGLARTAELHDLFALTGRLGYADGRWHAYAKGGWASAEVDVSYEDTVAGIVTSTGGRENGWIAGVGIDYALSYNLFLGIEYNYLHFNADVVPPAIQATEFDDGEFDVQTLAVRLNYRFGGPVH